MTTLAPKELLGQLTWRYATKQFDATRKIPADVMSAIEDALVLSPSSYGLQPWKALVITDPALRVKLREVSWNQPQITDSSHLVVLCAMRGMGERHIDHFIARTAALRGASPESLAGYRGMMVGDLVKGPRAAIIDEWTKRQAFLALGVLLSSAAVLGVDACPMEGFDPSAYDRILGLTERGLAATVICALGYRAVTDAYGGLAKVRFPKAEVIERR